MKPVRKIAVATLAIGAVSLAGTALAETAPQAGANAQTAMRQDVNARGGWGKVRHRKAHGKHQAEGRILPDMPQELRAKAVEAEKLRIDLREVLAQNPVNREKAKELRNQIEEREQEIRAWRFEQKLNSIDEARKQAASVK